MGAALSHFTTYLASSLCGGSSRKLIAGWWYSILALSLLLSFMTFWTASTRGSYESFSSMWSCLLIVGLCVGGTMVMRRYHTSIAVGLFMGSVVATAQLFFLLFLIYLGYASDRRSQGLNTFSETLSAFFCLVQCILLGSFAAILGAHRSQILDKPSETSVSLAGTGGGACPRRTHPPPTIPLHRFKRTRGFSFEPGLFYVRSSSIDYILALGIVSWFALHL